MKTVPKNKRDSEDEDDTKDDLVRTFLSVDLIVIRYQPLFVGILLFGLCFSFYLITLNFVYAITVKEHMVPRRFGEYMMYIFCFDMVHLADIFLVMIFYKTKPIELDGVYDVTPPWMTLVRFLCLLPFDGVYWIFTKANMHVVYVLRLRYVFRMLTYSDYLSRLRLSFNKRFYILEAILQFGMVVLIATMSTSCFLYYYYCQNNRYNYVCDYGDGRAMSSSVAHATTMVIQRGFLHRGFMMDITDIVINVIGFLLFLVLFGYTIGAMTVGTYLNKLRKFFFGILVNRIMFVINVSFRKDPLTIKTVKSTVATYWKMRGHAELSDQMKEKLPQGIINDLYLDVSWYALKHSHLFRDLDIGFLRFVASMMHHWYFAPGEIVYRRGVCKERMIYLVSGVVQILSDEDGETPIISFRGGTVLGESCLLQDYPSSCSVVCLTYCIVHILERKQFVKGILKYPKYYRNFQMDIQSRYKRAKGYKTIAVYQTKGFDRQLSFIALKYVKTAVQRLNEGKELLDEDVEEMHDHEIRKTNEILRSLVFCAKYLDLLVLADEMDLAIDTTFIRQSFPHILKPDSFLYYLWQKWVSIVALWLSMSYPYYVAFNPHSMYYLYVLYAVSFIWLLDIYIKLNTATISSNVWITKMSEIIWINIFTFQFWLDFLSVIPIELIVNSHFHITDQIFMLSMANRLGKFTHVNNFFNYRYKELIPLKVIIYTLLSLMYFSSVFYMCVCFNQICPPEAPFTDLFIKFKNQEFIAAIFYGHQITTGFILTTLTSQSLSDTHYFYIYFVTFVSVFVYVYSVSQMICYYFFSIHNFMTLNNRIEMISTTLKKYNLSKSFSKRALSFYRNNWTFNRALFVLFKIRIIPELPYDLYKNAKFSNYYNYAVLFPILRDMPKKFLSEFCVYIVTNIFHPNEVIIYKGETSKECYLILNGYCETTDGDVKKTLKPKDTFAVIDCCFELPSPNTVYSVSHVVCFSFKHGDFKKVLSKFPNLVGWMNNLKQHVQNERYMFNLHTERFKVDFVSGEEKKAKSVHFFRYKTIETSRDWLEYNLPFQKRKVFFCLRFVLMRCTFGCSGRLVYIWEVFRISCALVTAFVAILPGVGYCNNCRYWYVLLVLDLVAWIDIYLRHHITYYNEQNIHVTHPLKTALHYWSHSFFVDVFAAMPVNILFSTLAPAWAQLGLMAVTRLNRLLQLYRVVPFLGLRHLNGKTPKWAALKYLPFFILIIYTSSLLVLEMTCDLRDFKPNEVTTGGLICHKNSWLYNSIFKKPLDPVRAMIIIIFQITSSLTAIGMSGYECNTAFDCIFIWFPCTLGHICRLFFIARFSAIYLNVNFREAFYQRQMRDLVSFLNFHKIGATVKNEVVHHFELVWQKNKGQDLQNITKDLHYALRGDILFDAYSPILRQSEIFATADSSFLHSLLMKTMYQTYLNRGLISRVNDIQENIFITIHGNVEVLGPDGNRLLLLPPGSMFGNLDKTERSRMTLSMVARGHAVVLAIKTMDFYQTMSSFKKFQTSFFQRIAVYVDYLPGGGIQSYEDELQTNQEETEHKSSKFYSLLFDVKIPGKSLYAWEIFLAFTIGVFSTTMESFHICVKHPGVAVVTLLYLLDLLYIIHVFLKFHICYEDAYGILIKDKKKIIDRYLKNPLGFAMDMATIFPFEIISLFFIKNNYFWCSWSFFRTNKLLKIYFVVDLLRNKRKQLSASIFFINLIYSLFWFQIYVLILSILITNVSCIFPDHNFVIFHDQTSRTLFKCNWYKQPFSVKLMAFCNANRIVISCITATGLPNIYPDHTLLIAIMSFILMLTRVIVLLFISATLSNLFAKNMSLLRFANDADKLMIYMKRERASMGLVQQIWNYIWLLWKNNQGEQMPRLLQRIPYYLKEAIMNSLFGYHLQIHPVLGRFHLDLLRQMAAVLEQRIYFSGDTITFVNDLDENMYFIHEGIVEVIAEVSLTTGRVVKKLLDGDMFGLEQGLNPRKGQFYTYRAKKYTVVLMLNYRSWFHLLQFFPASRAVAQNLNLLASEEDNT